MSDAKSLMFLLSEEKLLELELLWEELKLEALFICSYRLPALLDVLRGVVGEAVETGELLPTLLLSLVVVVRQSLKPGMAADTFLMLLEFKSRCVLPAN